MKHKFRMLPLILLVFCLLNGKGEAVEMQEVRIRAGLDLFSSLLAADMDIESKAGDNGSLLLILVYTDNQSRAEKLAERLERVGRIRNIPIHVEISDERSMDRFEERIPAGIFISQPMPDTLDALLSFGRRHHIIVFSPFEGDVERGVSGGIHISDKLLPYLNVSALKSSNVRIKSFFMRVSRHYDKQQ